MITPTDNSNLQFLDSESEHARLASMNVQAHASTQSPITMLDDLLRGRWKLAIGLGVVLAGICAVAGFRFAPIRYSSTGQIRVAPTGSPILHETKETVNVLNYHTVVGTQAQLVRSPRVIDLALQSPTLSGLDIVSNPNASELVSKKLAAKAVIGTELIAVTYESTTPTEAQLVVNAVLDSYYKLYGESGGDKRAARLQKLFDRRTELQGKRNINRKETRDFITNSEYAASDLRQILEIKLAGIEELRQTLAGIDLEMAMLGMNDNTTEGYIDIPIPEPLVEELELIDPDLAKLRLQFLDLEVELQQLKEKYNGNETHHAIISKMRILATLEETIANRIVAARERWYAAEGSVSIDGTSTGRMSPEQLVERRAQISEMLAKAKDEVRQLSEDQSRLTELQQKENDTNEDLDEVTDMIDILKLESDPSMFSGRIEIVERGSKSLSPSKDKRFQLAVAGCVGGFGFSLGLFVLLGILDKRAYSVSQLKHDDSKYRCLGVLPDLAEGKLDPARAEVAVHCVHQIRNKIEAHRIPIPSFVLLVTSPQQGDGKTSLAMALASSYAYAGYRTLIVDCDLVGMGVTKQHNLSQHRGLREVLSRKIEVGQATRVISSNLDVLCAGLDTRFGPESVRRDGFSALCSELRRTYDVILLDTGPFIGSVELLPIAASADCVVLTVRRGRSRHRLEECVADLDKLNVQTLGVVLNRAVRSDCDSYVSYSVISERRLIMANSESQNGELNNQPEVLENVLMHAMNLSHDDVHESNEKK